MRLGTAARPLRAGDVVGLQAMLNRCSPATRHQRFHGVVTEIPPAYLRRCLTGEHLTRVADVGGDLVGIASVGPVFDEPDVHEAAVLVEDRWQRCGIGRTLLGSLFAVVPAPVVRMEVTRSPLLDHLLATLPVISSVGYGADMTIDVDVAAVRRAAGAPAPRRPCSTAPRPVAPALP